MKSRATTRNSKVANNAVIEQDRLADNGEAFCAVKHTVRFSLQKVLLMPDLLPYAFGSYT